MAACNTISIGKKKREYSRNGCQECKRRKLKCDEAKPHCWQCSHLNKKCVYMKTIKFSDTRDFTYKAKKRKASESSRVPTSEVSEIQIIDFNSQNPRANTPKKQKEISSQVKNQLEDHILHHEPSTMAVLSDASFTASESSQRTNLINTANMLANDMIETLDPGLDEFLFNFKEFELDKKKSLIDSILLDEPHKTNLSIFYDKVSIFLVPLNPGLCNEIMFHQAKNAPYLLAAMLSSTDEALKKTYITTCLNYLTKVFQEDQTNIINNIEPLILTVLLLAADSTSTNWRTHLRGAKDLFTKYIKLVQTPALLLAKSWFATIEILASMESLGTINVQSEFDQLLDVGLYGESSDMAIDIGLLLPNGYNIMLGYSSEAILMYREFCKLGKSDSSEEILMNMSLIHSAREFYVASENIIIELDNPAHPSYVGPGKLELPSTCYGFKGDKVYSWFDLSHQLHVDSVLLRMYTHVLGLTKEHPLVRSLVKRMFDLCFFFNDDPEQEDIYDPEDHRVIIVHGCLLVAGMYTIADQEKRRIMVLLQNMLKAGIKSAKTSMTRLENVWEGKALDEITVDQVPFW